MNFISNLLCTHTLEFSRNIFLFETNKSCIFFFICQLRKQVPIAPKQSQKIYQHCVNESRFIDEFLRKV